MADAADPSPVDGGPPSRGDRCQYLLGPDHRYLCRVEKLGAHLSTYFEYQFPLSYGSGREWLECFIFFVIQFFGKVHDLIPKTACARIIRRPQNQGRQAAPSLGGEPR